MRKLNAVLLATWSSATGKHERDFLRALHNSKNIRALALELNRFALPKGFAVHLSSLWVDWQPQSWKWIKAHKQYQKPSVELADLVVIVWDDASHQSGKALILAAKMGVSHNSFAPYGKSTQKEKTFLESPYPFLLSNSLSGTPASLPGFTYKECEFDFSTSKGFNLWRWLLIKKNTASNWGVSRLRFTAKSESATTSFKSFGEELVNLLLNRSSGRFFVGCMTCEWCRLINLLLGHTSNISRHPKAQGPARVDNFVANNAAKPNLGQTANCSFQSVSLLSCLPSSLSPNDATQQAFAGNDGGSYIGGVFNTKSGDGPFPQCSFLFLTKSDIPEELDIENGKTTID